MAWRGDIHGMDGGDVVAVRLGGGGDVGGRGRSGGCRLCMVGEEENGLIFFGDMNELATIKSRIHEKGTAGDIGLRPQVLSASGSSAHTHRNLIGYAISK